MLIRSHFLLTLFVVTYSIFTFKLVLILSVLFSNIVFTFGEFANKYFAMPNLNLVNEPDLTKILKIEIFVHTDGQLRVAHLILGYNPTLSNFQAPKYMIKAKDLGLHQINIAVPSFLAGPAPKGVQQLELRFQRTSKEEATFSQPAPKETVRVVEVSNSKEDFEFFNQIQSPEPPVIDFSHLPLA